jgi:hypothetical protein
MNLKHTEIDLLANDVRENINQTLEITKFSITASSALIGFGLSGITKQGILSAFICLLPIPIIIAAVEMIFNRRSNVMKKATYLRVFGGKDYVWELFLREQRERHKKEGSSFTRTLIKMLKAVTFISIIASIILLCTSAITKGYYKGAWPIGHIIEDPSKFFPLIVTSIIFASIAGIFFLILQFFKKTELNIENVLMGGDAEELMAEKWINIEKNLNTQNNSRLPE